MTDIKTIGKATGGIFVLIVMAVAASNFVATSDISAVTVIDSQAEWQAEQASITNTEITSEGYLQLQDGETSGTYTTVTYDYTAENYTEVKAAADGFTENNSADVTVTYYDDTDSQVGTDTASLSQGETSIDISNAPASTATFEIETSLSRNTVDDATAQVDYETIHDDTETNTDLYEMLVVLLAVGGIVAVIRSIF